MELKYTAEKNHQILLALMKEHGIKKVVISPGTTNVSFAGSLQNDPDFELYSSIDERSAAYIACGLAAESGEPVALSCTFATASRNYLPGLTEAYYRKLPVLAVTSARWNEDIGHNIPQTIDRTQLPKDVARCSVYLPEVRDGKQAWACQLSVNRALLELRRAGGGPVHINLQTNYTPDFSVQELPKVYAIQRYSEGNKLPSVPKTGSIAIFAGAHLRWSDQLVQVVDRFCEKYNAVVLCDRLSNYFGKYRVLFPLIAEQHHYDAPLRHMDLLIHMGDISDAASFLKPKFVWRVHPDGEIRDLYKALRCVFEMSEEKFFSYYTVENSNSEKHISYYSKWKEEYSKLEKKAIAAKTQMPFSNVWIAMTTLPLLPDCVLHLGILNSLRSWNLFEGEKDILGYSNVGGFGIDGGVSSLLGASLADKTKLYIGVVGDLAFFYDMNSLGNRHLGPNFRLMIINNGRGQEFRNKDNFASRSGFGNQTDLYIAAAGHFGNQSKDLVQHFATNLGFEYMSASDKMTYKEKITRFLTPEITKRPMLFEVFTSTEDETIAHETIFSLEQNTQGMAKQIAKDMLGQKNLDKIKRIMGK